MPGHGSPPSAGRRGCVAVLLALAGPTLFAEEPRPAPPTSGGGVGLMLPVLLAPVGAETVKVFAAASLQDALGEAARAFEASGGPRLEASFAGSQVLRTQIEHGATAHLFVSADRAHAEALAAAGLAAPPAPVARTRIVVVVPASAGRVRTLADLGRPGTKVVWGGPAVPAGRYAAEALRRLAGDPAFGREWAGRVRANVVSEEPNVRAVLAKVVLGEADAGFVYATDAAAAGGRVRRLDLPSSAQVGAGFVAVLVGREPPAAARAFLAFLRGDAGQAVLRRHGFDPP